jgi:hypothetical protein
MGHGRARARAGAAATLAAVLLLAGCGTTDAGPQAKASAVLATPKPPPTADTRACVGAEAVIKHVTVDTARWSPTQRPFDKVIAGRLATQAQYLAAQGPQAHDPRVRSAVGATASAFTGVAASMKARNRAGLTRAIARSRVAYKHLKQVCSLGQ